MRSFTSDNLSSMKDRIISGDAAKIVGGWSPGEIVDETQLTEEAIDVERILAIFRGEVVNDTEVEPQYLSGSGSAADVWIPADLPSQEEILASLEQQGKEGDEEIIVQDDDTEAGEIETAQILEPSDDELLAQAQDQAEEFVNLQLLEAQRQASEIVQAAKAEAEEITRTAYQEGKERGQTEMGLSIQAAKAMLEEFSSWRVGMLEQSEENVVGLVKEIADIMFSGGAVLENEALQHHFGQVLMNARTLGDMRVYVHPDDAKALDPAWREYQVLISGQKIQIFPTDAIQRGGCFIEGQRGSADARIETQLKNLLESLSTRDERDDSPASPQISGSTGS